MCGWVGSFKGTDTLPVELQTLTHQAASADDFVGEGERVSELIWLDQLTRPFDESACYIMMLLIRLRMRVTDLDWLDGKLAARVANWNFLCHTLADDGLSEERETEHWWIWLDAEEGEVEERRLSIDSEEYSGLLPIPPSNWLKDWLACKMLSCCILLCSLMLKLCLLKHHCQLIQEYLRRIALPIPFVYFDFS